MRYYRLQYTRCTYALKSQTGEIYLGMTGIGGGGEYYSTAKHYYFFHVYTMKDVVFLQP